MEISDQLQCLFSGHVEETDETYQLEVPKREFQFGTLTTGETYRIAVMTTPIDDTGETAETNRETESNSSNPPVAEGERRTVEIEDVGDQGDGLTRVERGFVVIVPETDPGERVNIEISNVRDNVAFGEVVDRLS